MNFLDFNIASATVFSYDIDTFIYEGAGINQPIVMKMIIHSAGGAILDTIEETYITDSTGLLKIFGLAKLFNNYILLDADYSIISTAVNRKISVDFTLTYTTTTKTCSRVILYSRSPMSVYATEFKSIPGLLRKKKTNTGRYEPFFFQTYGTTDPVITLSLGYLKAGAMYYPSATICDTSISDSYAYVDLSVSNVIALTAPGETITSITPLFYDVVVKYDGIQIDKMRYMIDENFYPQESGILYYNLFGIPSTLHFTGQITEKLEQEAAFGYIDDNYRALDRDISISHDLYSGWISNHERPAYKDLLQSPYIAIYRKNGNNIDLSEIAITGMEWSVVRPTNECDNVKITYRHAQKNQILLDVIPWQQDDYIFPKPPFDVTFD